MKKYRCTAKHSSRKRTKHGKNVKSHDFVDFGKNVKNVKNVEVISYIPIVLNTTLTTLNQFCCLSHNSKAISLYYIPLKPTVAIWVQL